MSTTIVPILQQRYDEIQAFCELMKFQPVLTEHSLQRASNVFSFVFDPSFIDQDYAILFVARYEELLIDQCTTLEDLEKFFDINLIFINKKKLKLDPLIQERLFMQVVKM